MSRVRCRCLHCGEEVNPNHPICCNSLDDIEEIPEELLSLYERDFPVDLDGRRYTGRYGHFDEEE